MEKTITKIEEEMRSIMGQWDGVNPGIEESRAVTAENVLEALKNVKELLKELE